MPLIRKTAKHIVSPTEALVDEGLPEGETVQWNLKPQVEMP